MELQLRFAETCEQEIQLKKEQQTVEAELIKVGNMSVARHAVSTNVTMFRRNTSLIGYRERRKCCVRAILSC